LIATIVVGMTKPLSIKVASAALGLAVLAGVAESVVAIGHFATTTGLTPADNVQIAIRAIVYAAGLTLVALLYRGVRFARWALLIMIGLLWLGTLVIPMSLELISGDDLRSVFGGDVSGYFPIIRGLHLVLVPIGLVAMFSRSVSAYLTKAPRMVSASSTLD
jgi:hypothetical protein